MAHSHQVRDSDSHFKIDPITRAITNQESKKTIIMQNDHNSECFSFEIPRFVENHDITLCNKVEIHYTNSDATKQESNPGVYEVNDMKADPNNDDLVVFSWLVSENATRYAGSLSFIVLFSCVENGVSVYRWNTAINNSISIAKGMNNGEGIAESYPDILTQWKNDLFAAATGNKLISVGPIEPDSYPYIWIDTSEYLDTPEKNVGYLTIKTGDGISQRLYPVVKMDSIEGLMMTLKEFDKRITDGMSAYDDAIDELNKSLDDEKQTRIDSDNLLDARIDDLEKMLTNANTAIAHSLSTKGVDVPADMTIDEVAALIDSITMDIPTALQGIGITTPPTKTEYYVGDSVNTAGMVVSANFGDGVSVAVSGYSVTPTTIAEDTTHILVSLTVNGVTKTATQSITVNGSIVDTLSAGAKIAVAETDSEDVWYTLVDTDYLGNALLVRDECLPEGIKYHYVAFDTANSTKYAAGSNSMLDNYLTGEFYSSLPGATSSIIQEVEIPVRSYAGASATQSSLSRKIFVLSATEWGLEGSALEGEPIEYTSSRANGDSYWTREPAGGMTNMAYFIDSAGDRSSTSCNSNMLIRPAFCVSTSQRVAAVDGGFKLVV